MPALEITQLDSNYCVSAQVHPDDLPRLKEAGYRTLINNRPDGEEPGQPTAKELSRLAAQLGLRYAHIPIVPGQMTDQDARDLAKAIGDAGGPVLAFCRTGTRSANLWKRSRELAGATT